MRSVSPAVRVAPPYYAGPVYFYAAGNAANGDGSTSGDNILTAADSVMGPPAAVTFAGVARPRLDAPAHNPSRGPTAFGFALPRAGAMDLLIFDLSGRRVRTVFHGTRPAGESRAAWDGMRADGRPAPAGAYFVRLTTSDRTRPLVRKLTLAR